MKINTKSLIQNLVFLCVLMLPELFQENVRILLLNRL